MRRRWNGKRRVRRVMATLAPELADRASLGVRLQRARARRKISCRRRLPAVAAAKHNTDGSTIAQEPDGAAALLAAAAVGSRRGRGGGFGAVSFPISKGHLATWILLTGRHHAVRRPDQRLHRAARSSGLAEHHVPPLVWVNTLILLCQQRRHRVGAARRPQGPDWRA